jgi:hypothetical protein
MVFLLSSVMADLASFCVGIGRVTKVKSEARVSPLRKLLKGYILRLHKASWKALRDLLTLNHTIIIILIENTLLWM